MDLWIIYKEETEDIEDEFEKEEEKKKRR